MGDNVSLCPAIQSCSARHGNPAGLHAVQSLSRAWKLGSLPLGDDHILEAGCRMRAIRGARVDPSRMADPLKRLNEPPYRKL
jgi:hypothetical protein